MRFPFRVNERTNKHVFLSALAPQFVFNNKQPDLTLVE